MEPMATHPHLLKRGAVFWYRRKVPADLRDHYAPKTHFAFSLRTQDRKKAVCEARIHAVRLDAEFDRVRRLRDAPIQDTVTDDQIARIVARHLHNVLDSDDVVRWDGAGDEALYEAVWGQLGPLGGRAAYRPGEVRRGSGMSSRELAKAKEAHDILAPTHRLALAQGDTSVIECEVDDLLESEGLKLDRGSRAYRGVARAVLAAQVQADAMLLARMQGEVVETPPLPQGSAKQVPPGKEEVPRTADGDDVLLSEVWRRYIDERKPEQKHKDQFATNLHQFIEVNGDLPIRSITKQHVRNFKDALLKLPARRTAEDRRLTVPQIVAKYEGDTSVQRLTLATLNVRRLGGLSAVFGYAVANGYRDDNPVSGLKAAGPASKGPSRLPYSIADLNTIFASPVFVAGQRPTGGAGEAAKWLPLLALFTGARLTELGQLHVADVCEEQGITHLFIHGDGEGRSVKTRGSRRRVPVHRQLVALGFLDYVADRRQAGDTRLFPDLTSHRSQVTAAFSQWWGRYVRGLGITDKRKTFHSFRHNAKQGLRNAGVDQALRDALQGHRSREVGEQYGLDEEGMGFALPILAEALSKLVYQGLDLSRVAPAPPSLGIRKRRRSAPTGPTTTAQ